MFSLGSLGVFFILVAIAGGFVLWGLKKVPADPPHKAVLTIWGKRQSVVKDEGWRFFPLYPYWYGFIKVDITKVEEDLDEQLVRTPDFAELGISASYTWRPDTENLIEFLNSGGKNGVNRILTDTIQSRLREWAVSPELGPQNWEKALGAQDDATATLIKEIVGLDSVSPELIKKIRQGNGIGKVPSLGIIMNRLNVREIRLKGELAKAAELKVKEDRERKAEEVELEHIAARIAELRQTIGFTAEEAKELIQTERKKVIKTVSETKLNLSPETREMIEKMVPVLLEVFAPRKEPEKIILWKEVR